MNDRVRVYHLTELKDRRRDLRKKSTPTEKILWQQLRNSRLGFKFRRQYSVRGYVIDFYCSKLKLGIELEGGIHNTKDSKIYDTYRERYLEAFGIKIIKIRNREVENSLKVTISKITSYLTPDPSPQLWRGEF